MMIRLRYTTPYEQSARHIRGDGCIGAAEASLTTSPAARFNGSSRRRQVAKGMDADLVVLQRDPAGDVRAFAAVRFTTRAGRVLH
jgi:imidazolonepropionase-like amidohydrolase